MLQLPTAGPPLIDDVSYMAMHSPPVGDDRSTLLLLANGGLKWSGEPGPLGYRPTPLHFNNNTSQTELSACSGAWAMRQRILGSHTPPCHRRMVITTLSSMFCLAALQRKPDQCRMLPCVRHSRWLSKVLRLFGSARSQWWGLGGGGVLWSARKTLTDTFLL